MLNITRFTCEGLKDGCVTDETHPSFSYTLEGDGQDIHIASVKLEVLEVKESLGHTGVQRTRSGRLPGDRKIWEIRPEVQTGIRYKGASLKPNSCYAAVLTVEADSGDTARSFLSFHTGMMGTDWSGSWITDARYRLTQKKRSPRPMTFRRQFHISCERRIRRAYMYATALGIYTVSLNGESLSDRYFAPGFTDYRHSLQYQTYQIEHLLKEDNELFFYVAGGWAVGSFGLARKNKIYADRQALLVDIRLEYEDGTVEVIGSDGQYDVCTAGPFVEADLYDGEVYDGRIDVHALPFHKASVEKLRVDPQLLAEYGSPVRIFERRSPVCVRRSAEGLIYDFGQNMAGIVSLRIRGKEGQTVTARHAELLDRTGRLQTDFLRTAKARFTYICREGEQIYTPAFTYMGFRYMQLNGVDPKDVDVEACALSSDAEVEELFTCSDADLTRLAENIYWSARSNFVDIPTDCSQRDERMGWTGDIAIFAPTALATFRMERFLKKWLRDMRSEQRRGGGIPNTIPSAGFGFPETMPVLAVDFWGDASVLVPWALYERSGDRSYLQDNYGMMKRYVNACLFWAGLCSVGDRRYLWHTPHALHFGDWVAPDVPHMHQWQKRSPYTATASLAHTSELLAKIAEILGKKDEQSRYKTISRRAKKAYRKYLTDQKGRLKREFQTGYVLPLYFDIFPEGERAAAAGRLVELVRRGGYRIGTGFPGTPYILFALCDNGYVEDAYAMLQNKSCPSWLYEVVQGATTMWERWDGLDENGQCPIGEDGTDHMISYNHYAGGAVGDFLYRRVLGVDPLEAGYTRFRVQPVPGGDLTWAKGCIAAAVGTIRTEWRIEQENMFLLKLFVPVGSEADVYLPDGSSRHVTCGSYEMSCPWRKDA